MCIAISALLAFHFEPFAASDAADIFPRIERMAVVARDEIGCACLSPRYPIPLVGDRPDEEVERQTDQWRQEGDQQDADHLEAEAIGPVDDILGRPDDGDDPQEDEEDREDIHPQRDAADIEQRGKAPRGCIEHDTDSGSHDAYIRNKRIIISFSSSPLGNHHVFSSCSGGRRSLQDWRILSRTRTGSYSPSGSSS